MGFDDSLSQIEEGSSSASILAIGLMKKLVDLVLFWWKPYFDLLYISRSLAKYVQYERTSKRNLLLKF